MASQHMVWLPNPPRGTRVCAGFDGSENDDWTIIKMETVDGLLFTPRYGPDQRPTVWNPKEWGGRIPRGEVHAAWDELFRRYKVGRVYADPGFKDELSWESEIESWDIAYGPKRFIPWSMAGSSRITAVYRAIRRFEADIETGALKHDGDPITTTAVGNARRIAKTAERYGLGKPAQERKIDAAVTSILAHEAACDARASGWGSQPQHNFIYTGASTRRT